VLWIVPHDNEGDAFDTAVYGVRTYGGTVVAVKTGGKRMNGLQDPNRNFDIGGGEQCPRQVARSPDYTKRVMRWWDGSAPILALHTNEPGYEGDGKGGRGTISIARRTRPATRLSPSWPGRTPNRSVRKWKGQLLDVDLPHLRRQLEASRDDVFNAAGIPQDLFRSN
jgi:hypothetical protein